MRPSTDLTDEDVFGHPLTVRKVQSRLEELVLFRRQNLTARDSYALLPDEEGEKERERLREIQDNFETSWIDRIVSWVLEFINPLRKYSAYSLS